MNVLESGFVLPHPPSKPPVIAHILVMPHRSQCTTQISTICQVPMHFSGQSLSLTRLSALCTAPLALPKSHPTRLRCHPYSTTHTNCSQPLPVPLPEPRPPSHRSQAGKTEKWRVLPYEPAGSPSLENRGGRGGGGGGGHGKGEKGSLGGAGTGLKGGYRGRRLLGTFVRKGDRVELENLGPNGKTLLVLRRREFAANEWEVRGGRRGGGEGRGTCCYAISPTSRQ